MHYDLQVQEKRPEIVISGWKFLRPTKATINIR